MTLRLMQAAFLLVLAACSASVSRSASPAEPPFAMSEVTRFDSPWAMTFIPGTDEALVPKSRDASGC